MKKIMIFLLCLWLLLFAGCGKIKPVNTIKATTITYYEMPDGTWEANGNSYKYRLEISGRMPKATSDSTFVYLSNLENISFEQAWKAAGFSSNTEDYFDTKDALFVEQK